MQFSSWIDFKSAVSALAAGVVSFGLCLLVPGLNSNLLTLVVKLAIFLPAYLTLAPLFRAVKYDDLDTLDVALAEMPVLRRPIHMIIAYEKSLASRDKTQPAVDR